MTKNEEKRLLLKRKIVEVTLNLIKELDYDQVTMEGIAKACNITKRTLYKYYPVKEAILAAYVEMTFKTRKEQRLERLTQITNMRDQVRFYMRELMNGVMREPVIFEKYIIYIMKNLVSYDQNETSPSGISDLIDSIIDSDEGKDIVDDSLPHQLVVDLFIFSFIEMTKFYYLDPERFDLESTVDIYVELFMKGIARNS